MSKRYSQGNLHRIVGMKGSKCKKNWFDESIHRIQWEHEEQVACLTLYESKKSGKAYMGGMDW